MDITQGLTLCLLAGVSACAYSWLATQADYRRALARCPSPHLHFLVVCCLQTCRVLMALNILFAIMSCGVWLLAMLGLPTGGRDISAFLDSPSMGPMHILHAVLLWLPVRFMGLQESRPADRVHK